MNSKKWDNIFPKLSISIIDTVVGYFCPLYIAPDILFKFIGI